MAPLTKLPLFLILYYSTHFITHTLATPPTNNTTNDDDDNLTICRDTDIWIQPSWPQDIFGLCEALIDELYMTEREILMSHPPLHEFLPMGIGPFFPDLERPVRTPWRIRNGGLMDTAERKGMFG